MTGTLTESLMSFRAVFDGEVITNEQAAYDSLRGSVERRYTSAGHSRAEAATVHPLPPT